MEIGAITEYIDVAQVTLYVFWVFFAGLVFHLQQESRREGFPLESDTGKRDAPSFFFTPPAKTFLLPHGHGSVTVPNDERDLNADYVKARRMAEFEGTPWVPTGDNPMLDGVGPGAWTARANVPDMTAHGEVKIVPMSVADDFRIAEEDIDPRGLRVVGCDSVVAGRVTDVWVDRSEQIIRFLELRTEVGDEPRNVLVPMNFCLIRTPRDREKILYVHAITGAQFADVPATRKRREITLREEDQIMAYYGGGLLYATPSRQESLI